MNYLKLSVIPLAFLTSISMAQQQVLSHDMEPSEETVFTIGKDNFLGIMKDKSSYQLKITNSSNEALIQTNLPWKPSHLETFNDIERSLIGSLKKNGFNGDGNLAVLDSKGIVKSFKNVSDYGSLNSSGGFFIISNEVDKPTLSTYSENLKEISSRNFPSELVKRSMVSVSKDGKELVFSSPSPDMSHRKSITKYSGHNFSKETKYEFGGAPLYQAVSFGDNQLAINVGGKLVAFRNGNAVWTYEPKPYFSANLVSTSQDKNYLIIKGDSGEVALISSQGDEIFRVNNKNGSEVSVKGKFALVTSNGLAKKFSLETGKKVQEVNIKDTNKVIGLSQNIIYISDRRNGGVNKAQNKNN
ncbi:MULTISPECIES: hypothetical protein [Idiomarina]|uniref:hypothetical protein n=1 Tax=Idiomarina TaxID=135575 RepID=UPI000C665C29|nr:MULTISPECIES: hypothetical protein [Idiomarina]MBP59453.1 hypothetical protein [Idiomarina sp.]|tara:strand:- start:28908 stop:29978 length:1071 start_codon:yes stop_codon:yes gene_type:complete